MKRHGRVLIVVLAAMFVGYVLLSVVRSTLTDGAGVAHRVGQVAETGLWLALAAGWVAVAVVALMWLISSVRSRA